MGGVANSLRRTAGGQGCWRQSSNPLEVCGEGVDPASEGSDGDGKCSERVHHSRNLGVHFSLLAGESLHSAFNGLEPSSIRGALKRHRFHSSLK